MAATILMALILSACSTRSAVTAEQASKGVLLGIFHEGSQKDLAPVSKYEDILDKEFASIMWFLDWSTPFPMEDVKRVSKAGYMPHITWEPWFFADQDKIYLENILAGEWDEYINQWASDAAKFGKPVMLRWGHEFNGNWYPWSVAKNGEDPQVYVDAYRKIHDAFIAAGADNVIWIWCSNNNSVPNEEWNVAMNAYPGDDYVDWVGIDGYNFSGTDSFMSLFAKSYSKMASELAKPVMVAEFATGGEGDKKSVWIQEMANDLEQSFPAIRAINWFDINKELDWRLIVDEQTETASKEAFSSDYFQSEADIFTYLTENYEETFGTSEPLIEVNLVPAERKKATALPVADNFALGGAWTADEGITLVSSDGEEDMSATIRFGWNKEALFFIADVTDDVPGSNNKSGGDIWNGDNVEICLGLDVNADPLREFFGKSDFQTGFSTGHFAQGKDPSIWAWGSISGIPEGAQSQITKTELGYILEGKIPWSALSGTFSPEKGMEIGLDVAVDDADASGDRENQAIWNGDSSFYSNPSQWGNLILQ